MANHTVAALAYPGMASFELGVVTEVFALPRPELELPWWYSFDLCAERRGSFPVVGGFNIDVRHGLTRLAAADTVIALGTADVHVDPAPAVLAAIRKAYSRGARIVSICSGAFVLAAAGLLDGRRAATHWRYASVLAHRFPGVRVDDRSLYIDDGQILTSAGTAAGIDLCLHLVRRDHGAEIANRVARRMVVATHRDGGQAQFIERPLRASTGDDPVVSLINKTIGELSVPLRVEEMARETHLSVRQFSRRFRAATGRSPGRWLIERRVHASLPLLEEDQPIERVAESVGFKSAAAFRKRFREIIALPPSDYRSRFKRGR
ncbi:MAG TPA: helix-turn-helix domain-containing protein [Candidatus Dormibacteraeota bacterium]|jgi:AraC family transcriptional activator FtrA|nr:helix-turn-helix domain-containing protein [Candidatus Dormibacteraeota bacterium]